MGWNFITSFENICTVPKLLNNSVCIFFFVSLSVSQFIYFILYVPLLHSKCFWVKMNNYALNLQIPWPLIDKVNIFLLCAKKQFFFLLHLLYFFTHFIFLYRGWRFNIWGLSPESECEWLAELQLHNRPMAALCLHLQVKPGVVPLPAEVLPGSGVQPLQVWH